MRILDFFSKTARDQIEVFAWCLHCRGRFLLHCKERLGRRQRQDGDKHIIFVLITINKLLHFFTLDSFEGNETTPSTPSRQILTNVHSPSSSSTIDLHLPNTPSTRSQSTQKSHTKTTHTSSSLHRLISSFNTKSNHLSQFLHNTP